MKIEAVTQTKSGAPVRIYATDGDGGFPIHGAVWLQNCWQIMDWNKNGVSRSLHKQELDLDLQHDWREDIPWEWLQNWIRWVAMGSNNDWYGFSGEPAFF